MLGPDRLFALAEWLGLGVLALDDQLDEGGDGDVYRATLQTGRLLALQTAIGLGPGLRLAVMAAWVVLPLGAAMTVFQKKEL